MTDPVTDPLSKYRLADHEHLSGCPAEPQDQEAYYAQRPPQKGLVQNGVDDSGQPVFVEATRPGERVVTARCIRCGAHRIFEVDNG